MPARLFTLAEEQKLADEFLKSGKPANHFAEERGMIGQTFRTILLRHGIKSPRRGRSPKYTIDCSVFDEIRDELAAYWLGFIYADGNVNKNMFTMALSDIDAHHLEKFNSFLKSSYLVHLRRDFHNGKYFGQAALHISQKCLADRLRSLGILPGRGNFKLAVGAVDTEVVRHFVRGIFDGDGGVDKGGRGFIFCGRIDMLRWIRMIMSAEIGSKPYKTIGMHSSGSVGYLWFYAERYSLREWLYKDATVWLERKRDIIDSW